jgi:hypothetical protein
MKAGSPKKLKVQANPDTEPGQAIDRVVEKRKMAGHLSQKEFDKKTEKQIKKMNSASNTFMENLLSNLSFT